jgi:hypothetical protein
MVGFPHGTARDGDDRQGNGLAVATRRVFFVSTPVAFPTIAKTIT